MKLLQNIESLGDFVIESLNRDANQARDFGAAQNATQRAARPDPSSSKMRPPQDDNADSMLNLCRLGACQFTG
jgi:hypothetical protein